MMKEHDRIDQNHLLTVTEKKYYSYLFTECIMVNASKHNQWEIHTLPPP